MQIIHGDCLEELKKLDDCSVDAIVTDPPYGLSSTKPAQVADVLKAWVTGDVGVVPAEKASIRNRGTRLSHHLPCGKNVCAC